VNHWTAPAFRPHPLLAGADLMTVAGTFWPRRYPRLPGATERLVETEPGTRILLHCHWQREPERHPALVLVHGLEGSSDSGYILGTAEKAWQAGFHVVRMNQRNCGGTDHLTPTLYNSSLSGDVRAVVAELIERDRIGEVFAAGFSLGGNLVMKMAGEMGEQAPPQLTAVVAISPSLDLAACAQALEQPRNCVYERHFLRRLKQRIRHKARLFPGRYQLNGIGGIRTIREFDDRITAPYSGFRDADDYYFRASALRVIGRVRLPALLVAAEDDPMVPFASFDRPEIHQQPFLRLFAPRRGGHCGFISRRRGKERFWAEQVIVEYCRFQSRLLADNRRRAAAGTPGEAAAAQAAGK
jgi:predicted alpha/beta-fold hydrolase